MEMKRMTLRLPVEAVLYLERAASITDKSFNQLIVDAITAMYSPSGDTMTPLVSSDDTNAPITQQKLDQVLALLRQHSDRLTTLEKSKGTSDSIVVSSGVVDDMVRPSAVASVLLNTVSDTQGETAPLSGVIRCHDTTKVPSQMFAKEFRDYYGLSSEDYGLVINDARTKGSWVSPDSLQWKVDGEAKKAVWTQVTIESSTRDTMTPSDTIRPTLVRLIKS